MKKRLAILPARGGSKRIPRKNIKSFAGQPLISHTLQAVESSGVFDLIHVSTDDDEIFNIVSDAGFQPDFMRPVALADDFTPMFDVVKHAAAEYEKRGEHFETIAVIFPTAPLIDPEDLKKACAAFEKSDQSKAVMSVTKFPCPIEWAYRKEEHTHALRPVNKGAFMTRSQDLEEAYYEAAMFIFFPSKLVLENSIEDLDAHFIGYEVPPTRVTDIDTPEDWEFAEQLYKTINGIDG